MITINSNSNRGNKLFFCHYCVQKKNGLVRKTSGCLTSPVWFLRKGNYMSDRVLQLSPIGCARGAASAAFTDVEIDSCVELQGTQPARETQSCWSLPCVGVCVWGVRCAGCLCALLSSYAGIIKSPLPKKSVSVRLYPRPHGGTIRATKARTVSSTTVIYLMVGLSQ